MKKDEEWQQEEQHLATTLNAIDSQLEILKNSTDENKEFVKELREYYVTGTGVFGALDSAEQVELTQRVDELVDINFQNIEKIEHLSKNRDKPYFGRVKFKSKELDDDFRVGLMGIEHNQEYFVYDWRAPICELFYDCGIGKASFRSPQGKIEGEILLKRQIEIENAKLVGIYPKDENLFDEYLQQILGRINTDKLHNIVSTIQQEQNKIIRDLKNDIVIVQGYAGSGKTTVALHRIAYALYRLRDLKSANILIFTLNEAFLSHINGVLPELGEQNTRSASIPKFLSRLLKLPRLFENYDDFLLRYTKSNKKVRNDIQTKLDLNIKTQISKWVSELENNLTASRGFRIQSIPISPKMLNKWFSSDYSDMAIENRFSLMAEKIVNKLKLKSNATAYVKIKDEILHCFGYEENIVKNYVKFCEDNKLIVDDFEVIKFEDALLMGVLKQRLKDMVISMDIRHILVDEAQEYPILFIDFLLRLFPRVAFTFLGDMYQQTNPFGIGDLRKIEKLHAYFGDICFYELDNSYRSSEEIVDYTSRIIGNPRHNAFRLKNNHPVKEIELPSSVNDLVSNLSAELKKRVGDNETIGIILGDVESAKVIYAKLLKLFDGVCLIKDATSVATGQIQILPVTLCKGLEFNTVFVVKNGGMFDSEFADNLTYIACTRAINELIVYSKK